MDQITNTQKIGHSVIADNILDRDFQADRPNQKWLADFTYIWTAEGWLYVAVVLDLFSRRAVGWSMKAERDASLVMDALMMAVWRRGKADALPHHSDQGSQYTSEQFQRLLADNGITCSMSRAGKVSDNSAMESFFSSLKTERTATKSVSHPRRSPCRCVRLHRALLQPASPPFETGLPQPHGVRGPRYASLIRCPRNRQQASRSMRSMRPPLRIPNLDRRLA